MLRLILALALLAATPAAAVEAPPLSPSPTVTPAGPGAARGALVWLHGSYDTDAFAGAPPEPAVVGRLAARAWDIWRFDRPQGRGLDPIAGSGERLIQGLRALRAAGYARILVAGHSRGAFIALATLRDTGLADGLALFSPAAHGARPDRRAEAMADFAALLATAQALPGMRIVLAQFTDDPLDPDPDARRALAQAMCARAGCALHTIFAPSAPHGHDGVYDPAFDPLFGAALAAFLDPADRPVAPPAVAPPAVAPTAPAAPPPPARP